MVLRAEGGDIAFLTGHVPFIGRVQEGTCQIFPSGGAPLEAWVGPGVVEMALDGTLVVAVEEGGLGPRSET